jgi:hypothetical protein
MGLNHFFYEGWMDKHKEKETINEIRKIFICVE